MYGRIARGHPFADTVGTLQATFHVPGVLMLPIAAVCQPTLTACVQLVVLQPAAGDRLLGVLGLFVVVGVMMVPFTIAISTQFCLELTSEPDAKKVRNVTQGDGGVSGFRVACAPLRKAREVLFGERSSWVPASHIKHSAKWKKQYIPIFVDCGTWWYPLADMWISASVGVIGGLTLSNTNVCRGQLSVVAFAYLLSLLLQVFLVQPLVLASKVYAVVIQVLGVVSCGAVTVALIQDEEKETLSVTVATYTMLMIALLSTVKSFADLVGLAIAFPVAMKKAHARVIALQKDLSPHLAKEEESDKAVLAEIVSESSLDNSDDQFFNDAAFTIVEVNPTEDASILNARDAPDNLAAPFDFIRDAASMKGVRPGGTEDKESNIDFVDLVFTDDHCRSIINSAEEAAITVRAVNTHLEVVDGVTAPLVHNMNMEVTLSTTNTPVTLSLSNTPSSLLLMFPATAQPTVAPSTENNDASAAELLVEPSDDFFALLNRPAADHHLDAEEPSDSFFAPLSRVVVSSSFDALREQPHAGTVDTAHYADEDDGYAYSGVLESLGMPSLAL
ncbi:membrane-associated protein, putative [Bodo saltans]|uniref:Membrane-associated protein, putative n=1 Tax=Bodo saltans TaxID=75058 RepID=A0A0S4JB84_BODSA|nr:membrane-associated protein, putative [Bodo saltans]|eukprot:CUG87428.1 membrane-associated protein, putative [Bodo saltans]